MSDLEAGPELDALVAEKVMGWTIGPEEYVHGYMMHGGSLEKSWLGSTHDTADGRMTFLVGGFKPSTNIAHAWKVVEKLCEIDEFALITCGGYGGDVQYWTLETMSQDHDERIKEPTAPLAICRAALKAMEKNG